MVSFFAQGFKVIGLQVGEGILDMSREKANEDLGN